MLNNITFILNNQNIKVNKNLFTSKQKYDILKSGDEHEDI